jgi:hypothetical protein
VSDPGFDADEEAWGSFYGPVTIGGLELHPICRHCLRPIYRRLTLFAVRGRRRWVYRHRGWPRAHKAKRLKRAQPRVQYRPRRFP